jgi:predicted CXXCH cytochrome family protein
VLPAGKTWPVRATDAPGLTRALADEMKYLGADPPEGGLHALLPAAATAMEQRLDGAKLVELGIGCEACHNGARAHAEHTDVAPSFAAQSPLVHVSPPRGQGGTDAQWINHTCAKCHTVLFTRYPWTWEGGKRRDGQPGGSSISSGEGRDYQLGGCASAMPCTTCHDPHVEDPADKLRELATPAGNAICTKCHGQYAGDAALAQHSHHKVGGAGAACIACHMAKKNMGLDYVLNRYHRIGSPTDVNRVEKDRPLECALCHADKSVDALVGAMETWWGKHYDRDALHRLYGPELAVNTMRATLQLGKPHEQAVAIVTLGDAKDASALPALEPMLAHDYPLVRYFAQRALQNITGDPVAIDVGAPAAQVRAAADRWLAQHH